MSSESSVQVVSNRGTVCSCPGAEFRLAYDEHHGARRGAMPSSPPVSARAEDVLQERDVGHGKLGANEREPLRGLLDRSILNGECAERIDGALPIYESVRV
jgi:hypothetical protein